MEQDHLFLELQKQIHFCLATWPRVPDTTIFLGAMHQRRFDALLYASEVIVAITPGEFMRLQTRVEAVRAKLAIQTID